MAYTPINWQTGDTITAEKLNRCDNGWSVENTQLFSETVTTEAGDYGSEGTLAYADAIDAPEITVTFGGVDYTCPRIDVMNSTPGYGGVEAGWTYDFTTYPFAIVSSGSGNILGTPTAGTYSIAAAAQSVDASADFAKAVNASVTAAPSAAVLCVQGVTNMDELQGAALGFFYEPDDSTKMHIIVTLDPCTIVPESSTLKAGFDRDGMFYVNTL